MVEAELRICCLFVCFFIYVKHLQVVIGLPAVDGRELGRNSDTHVCTSHVFNFVTTFASHQNEVQPSLTPLADRLGAGFSELPFITFSFRNWSFSHVGCHGNIQLKSCLVFVERQLTTSSQGTLFVKYNPFKSKSYSSSL